jgi:hypothetical protein
MEHLSKIMLYESHLRDLNREAEETQLAAQLLGRRAPWGTLLVVVVVLIGMIALWIH